jgi:hypothetical protein
MSIEQQLDRLVEALEDNTLALRGKSGEASRGPGRPAGSKNKTRDEDEKEDDDEEDEENDKDEDEEDDTPEDEDDVAEKKEATRKLMIRVKKEIGQEEVTALMKTFKAKSFDQIKASDYDKVARLAKKQLAGK